MGNERRMVEMECGVGKKEVRSEESRVMVVEVEVVEEEEEVKEEE